METKTMKRTLQTMILVFLTHPAIAATTSGVSEDPDFPTLLTSQPIVVVAGSAERIASETLTIGTEDGADESAKAEQQVDSYRLSAVELLAGELPKEFVVRTVPDSNGAVFEKASKAQADIVLVLAPDTGRDEAGKRRTSYLVAHRAAFVLQDGEFRTDSGGEVWTVQRIKDVLSDHAARRQQRLAESPEPANASLDDVFAGEETEMPEATLGEAVKTRPTAAKSESELAGSRPAVKRSPAAAGEEPPAKVDEPKSNIWIVMLILILIAAIALFVWMQRRRSAS